MSRTLSRSQHRLKLVCLAIGIMTVGSGTALVLLPDLALRILGAERTDATRYLFRIVGMFTGLFGGVLTAAVRSHEPEQVALVWCVVQKTGAFIAMSTAVALDVFNGLGLVVAVVDGTSAVLVYIHRKARRPSKVFG